MMFTSCNSEFFFKYSKIKIEFICTTNQLHSLVLQYRFQTCSSCCIVHMVKKKQHFKSVIQDILSIRSVNVMVIVKINLTA